MFGRATIRLGIGPHSSLLYVIINKYHLTGNQFYTVLRNRTISEVFYLLNLITKLWPILLLRIWWVSLSENKRN